MSEDEKGGVAQLVGAGDAIGAAVARRFAAGGYTVCIARRSAKKVPECRPRSCFIGWQRARCQYGCAQ